MTSPVAAVSHGTAHARRLVWLGCAAFALLALRGIWPIVPVEGDDQGVIFGVDGMVRASPDLLERRYLYAIQPGSYQVLAALVRWTGVSAQTVFASTTVIGALIFAGAGAWLLANALTISFAPALLAMLWCQETIAALCYLNTSTLSGAVALLSLVPFARASSRRLLVIGGIGLGVAGWLRGDALLVFPVAFALLARRHGLSWKAVGETALAASTALAVFLILRELSGAPLRDGLATYASMPSSITNLRSARDVLATLLSPILLLLSVLGFAWLAWRQDRKLLFVAAAGVLPALIAYHGALVSTKYLFYTVPFALIPALALLRAALERCVAWRPRWRACAQTAVGILAATDLAAGVRVLSHPARHYQPAPNLGAIQFTSAPAVREIVFGGGDVIPNEDGLRLRTGHFFAPFVWHREKTHQLAQLADLHNRIESESVGTIFFSGWLSEQLVQRELFLAGFAPQRIPGGSRWQNGTRIIDTLYLGHVGSPYQPPGLAPAPIHPNECYFVGVYGGRVPPTELADGRRWRCISQPKEGFITVYRRE